MIKNIWLFFSNFEMQSLGKSAIGLYWWNQSLDIVIRIYHQSQNLDIIITIIKKYQYLTNTLINNLVQTVMKSNNSIIVKFLHEKLLYQFINVAHYMKISQKDITFNFICITISYILLKFYFFKPYISKIIIWQTIFYN